MRTTWKPLNNETKPLTFLLALTFLFLFSGSVYGDEIQDGFDAYKKKTTKKQSCFSIFQQNREMRWHNFYWD